MKRPDVTLATALVGLLAMSIGAALVLAPAGLIVLGGGLLVYAVFLQPDQNGGPQP